MSTATDPLTARQRDILDWWLAYQAERGMSPTHREIGLQFGIKSPNGVKCHIRALAKKGYVVVHGKALSRSAVALDPDAPCCPTCGRPRSPETRGADA